VPAPAGAPAIEVAHLVKHYEVHHREAGLLASLRSAFSRKRESVPAVSDLSFQIAPGERVGFLGPNGAGKTTTLKILSGLLYPTSGRVRVHGYDPQHREAGFLKSVSLVMGQRHQLYWDLPPVETFALNAALYGVPEDTFRETLGELVELLSLQGVVEKPTRQLSLGERMKCELVCALLHRPRLMFLDEPTIGLDVEMQVIVRTFIQQYNERFGATVMLTSHHMDDVTALCSRVIVIDHGRIQYDGDLGALVRRVCPAKQLVLKLAQPVPRERLAARAEVASLTEAQATLRVPQEALRTVIPQLLAELPILDLSVEDPPLEQVLRELFAGASPLGGPAA